MIARSKSIFFLPFLLLMVAGCRENYPVYSKFCEENRTTFPKCLNYTVFDKTDKQRLKKSFGIIDDSSCPYHVELIKYSIGKCKNPVIKSTGSDFNGYVRVSIKKSFNCYYMIQSDYSNSTDRAFERVLTGIEKERKKSEKR